MSSSHLMLAMRPAHLIAMLLPMLWIPCITWAADSGLIIAHATAEVELGKTTDPQKEAFEAAIRAGFLQAVHRLAPRYRWSDLDTKVGKIAPAPLVQNLYPRTIEWRPKSLFVDLAIQFHPQKLADALHTIGFLVLPPFPRLNIAMLVQGPTALSPPASGASLQAGQVVPPPAPMELLTDLAKGRGWSVASIPLAFSDISIEPPSPAWLETLLVPRVRAGELGWAIAGTTVESRDGLLFTGWTGWIDQEGHGEVHPLDQKLDTEGLTALIQDQFDEVLDRWLELKGTQGQVRYSRLLLIRGFEDISRLYRLTAQLRRLPQVDDCSFLRYDDEGLTLVVDAHGPAIDLPRALERLGLGRPEDETDRLVFTHLRSSTTLEDR